MPHIFKCQIQTYEMLGTQTPLFASLLCLGHICMDFFSFNTRRKTYCARFHQALTREGEIPPFLALLSSDLLFIWDVETSVFCTWVFPSCAGRCHCPAGPSVHLAEEAQTPEKVKSLP